MARIVKFGPHVLSHPVPKVNCTTS